MVCFYSPSPAWNLSDLFKSELITLLLINHHWLPITQYKIQVFLPLPVRFYMIRPQLFSLTSSHTPLHSTHSVLATLRLLFLEYVELILAARLCMYAVPSSWNVFLPDFGMRPHPHFL